MVAKIKIFSFCLSLALVVVGFSAAPATAACDPLPSDKGQAAYDFTTSEAGQYTLWLRVLAPNAASGSVYVQVDDQCPVNAIDSPATDSFVWLNFRDGNQGSPMQLDLAAGNHTITLAGREVGMGIDILMLVSDPTCKPEATDDSCAASAVNPQSSAGESDTTNWWVIGACIAAAAGALAFLVWKYLRFMKAAKTSHEPSGIVVMEGVIEAETTLATNIKNFVKHHKIVVAVCGVIIVCATLVGIVAAADDRLSFEAEAGRLAGGAKITDKAEASGGKYVAFENNPAGSTTQGSSGGGSGGGGSGSGGSGGGGSQPPSGWPNSTNTGYKNAPGYPGSLTTFTGSLQSNQTYSFMYFPNGLYISPGLDNITFYGCRFTSNEVDDATVAVLGDNITFDYSTFEPKPELDTSPPVSYANGYQYGIDQRADVKVTVDHSDFWGWGNGIEFESSNQSKPFVVKNSWFHDARADGGLDHTDAIIESFGNQSYMVFHHNTIVSVGNTNGLALQGSNYSNVTVTNNYFSGFGYTVSVGHAPSNSSMVFTDNVWGTDLQQEYGPLYGWWPGPGSQWRRNKVDYVNAIHMRGDNPGSHLITAADDGKYWWPDDTLSNSDYTGL